MLLRSLFIAFFIFSQSNGNLLETKEIEDTLNTFIEDHLEEIISAKSEVEEILKELENINEEENKGLVLLQQVDAPQSCLNMLAETDVPCPDLQKVIEDSRAVLTEVVNIVVDGIKAYKDTLNSTQYDCLRTLNPLTALRCFLRAFRAMNNVFVNMKTQVWKLKDDAESLFNEFNDYRTECKKSNKLQEHQLQLVNICKKIHDTNSQ